MPYHRSSIADNTSSNYSDIEKKEKNIFVLGNNENEKNVCL